MENGTRRGWVLGYKKLWHFSQIETVEGTDRMIAVGDSACGSLVRGNDVPADISSIPGKKFCRICQKIASKA